MKKCFVLAITAILAMALMPVASAEILDDGVLDIFDEDIPAGCLCTFWECVPISIRRCKFICTAWECQAEPDRCP